MTRYEPFKNHSTFRIHATFRCNINAVGKSKARLQCKKALTPNGKHVTVDDGSPKVHIEDLILLKELVETGKIKPVIDRRYPLEQMAEAHRYVNKRHKKGNVVIFCTPRRAELLQVLLKPTSYQCVSSQDIGLPLGVKALAVERRALPGGAPF